MRFLRATLILLALAAPALARGPLERAEKFRPDVYPCKITAAEGAAARVVDALNGSMKFSEAGSTIVLADDGLCDDATAAVAQVLRQHFGGAAIVVGLKARPAPVDPGKLVTITTGSTEERDETVDDHGNKNVCVTGDVRLTVSGGGIERTFATRFEDKCWAADFKNFAGQHPGQRFVLGQSAKLASSESDALDAAREQAAKELYDTVKAAMNARNLKRADRIMVSEAFVRRQVESLLKQGECVQDTFVQRLEGPAGEVWRASVLVAASTANIDEMVKYVGQAARAQAAAQSARRAEQARGWGSVAAFFAVIVMLYLLVNSLTRGYFMWRLRAAALLVGIVGILLALAVT